ncbi:MAG: hypothetical protein LBT18_05910 [Endomicrobium sp.]|jgi:hypothetical protein|nr:hypothetical protein [Endomicrobium sp.]
MKKFVLAVLLCCAFAGVGNAERCSELCAACEKSQSKDIKTCCKAETACHGNCDAVKYPCPIHVLELANDFVLLV